MIMKFRKLGLVKSFLFNQNQQKASFFSKIKRHIDSYLEPGSIERTSALQDTNLSMYSNMRQFQSYLTKNAYDMSVNNEYDLWPHTNFGTLDNPLLVFSAGTSWRMVICSGPGNDEESSFHEKMYMIVREGPIHRCIMCGQCFKLQVLKDSISNAENEYYSVVFTDISPKVVSEPEAMPYQLHAFVSHDYQMNHYNISPNDRAYVMVDADEADHALIDPAYRMEKYKQYDDYVKKVKMVENEVSNQLKHLNAAFQNKQTIPKELFERWIEVEKAILTYDRIFNRYEKFAGRAFFDPENHARREQRMQERIAARNNENYTYYFNGLTEFEQNYRDYYETDVEDTNEHDFEHEKRDLETLRSSGEFDLNNWELEESSIWVNYTNAIDDILGKRLFRYKYRNVADPKFVERNKRVLQRYIERSQNRDPIVTAQIGELIEKHYVQNQIPFQITQMVTGTQIPSAKDELYPYMKYVSDEGFQQFMDYYETDEEEAPYFDYYRQISERDRLRFAEYYENFYSKSMEYDKYYVSIPKRPYDKSQSIFSNFVSDLVDFNNRVRPIARSLAYRDASLKHQILPMNEREVSLNSNDRYRKILNFNKTGNNYIDEINKGK